MPGIIADRFGTVRVLCAGALMYAAGLALMAHATTAPMLDVSAGVLLGFGLAGCSFTLVLAAFGKLLPAEWRSFAFGIGTAAGSFGQFLYSPIAVLLMDTFGWQNALTIFSVSMLAIFPLSLALTTPKAGARQRGCAAIVPACVSEAFAHRSYVLLVLGYFTCGFQLAFITVHLPSYLVDRGLSVEVGGWTLATIGLFNIVGSSYVRLARQPHAEALSAFVHLFRPARLPSLPSFRSRRRRSPALCSAPSWA